MSTTKISDTLKRLLFSNNMKIIDLARATNVPQQTVQRIVAGNCLRPHINSLQPIADFFKISVEQLKGIDFIDWLDTEDILLEDLGIRHVPLIDWSEIESWIENRIDCKNNTKIVTQTPVSRQTFALKIKDSSMEPVFPIDSVIIIDPNKSPHDRSYVLVKLEQYLEPIFRYLILDADDKFIKPISPNLESFSIHMIKSGDVIYGMLVESKHIYT